MSCEVAGSMVDESISRLPGATPAKTPLADV
jgi:hypothetical protein